MSYIDKIKLIKVLGVNQLNKVTPEKVNDIIDVINNVTDTGFVTQVTSIATGITTVKTSGVITTVNTTLAADASATFTITNSKVNVNSVVLLTIDDYSGTFTTNGLPIVTVDNRTNGTFDIVLSNAHATNALSGILKIGYLIVG